MMVMKMKIERFISGTIEEFQKKCTVFEKKANYKVDFLLPPKSINGYKINLEDIKELCEFLVKPQPNSRIHPPKDCDSIILDVDNNIFYLIELKESNSNNNNHSARDQLNAGLEWLKFLCFCLNIEFSSYKTYLVHVIVNPSFNFAKGHKTDDGIIKISGNSISLRKVIEAS